MDSIKVLSPTYALNLTTTATASGLQLVPNTPTRAYRVAVLNTGTGTAAITFGTTASNMEVPVVPTTGTGAAFVLAPSMFYPIVIDCGSPNVFVKGVSTGTNTIYLTLVATE
jgi:hypothetical protein